MKSLIFIVNYAKRHRLTCFTTNSFLLRHALLVTVLCGRRLHNTPPTIKFRICFLVFVTLKNFLYIEEAPFLFVNQ
jgi:hypothetical protein